MYYHSSKQRFKNYYVNQSIVNFWPFPGIFLRFGQHDLEPVAYDFLAVQKLDRPIGRLLVAVLCVAAGLPSHDVDLDEVAESAEDVLQNPDGWRVRCADDEESFGDFRVRVLERLKGRQLHGTVGRVVGLDAAHSSSGSGLC